MDNYHITAYSTEVCHLFHYPALQTAVGAEPSNSGLSLCA